MPEKSFIIGNIFVSESDSELSFGNGLIEVFFSKSNGQMKCVRDNVRGYTAAGIREREFQCFELHEGGEILPVPPRFPRFYSDEPSNVSVWGRDTVYSGRNILIKPESVELGIAFGDDRWKIEQIVELKPRKALFKIEWKITFLRDGETKLRKIVFRLPEITDEGLLASLPGAAVVPDSPIAEIPPLTYFKYGACLRNKENTSAFMAWATDKSFMVLNKCACDKKSLKITHEHFCAGKFRKNTVLSFGSDYFLLSGCIDDALDGFCEHYADAGFVESRPVVPWAKEAIIWEGCVGAILFEPDFSYSPYPSMADFKDDLPRIKKLGFNTIQLMPAMPFPWYTVYHYEDLAVTYGSRNEEELADFIRTVHSLGMRFLFDIVVHGVADGESSRKGIERYAVRNRLFRAGLENAEEVNAYRREHPEWFRYDEKGDISYLHTWSLDFESPTLCRMFTDHLKRCAVEFNCDGFRVDAPYWGCCENWAEDYPLWPGASFTRNVKALSDAKAELFKIKPDILWYTEHEHPEWRAYMDMTYTYEEAWLLWCPQPNKKLPIYEGAIDAKGMARWFDLRRRVLPREDIVLQHHIDSHDSWWNESKSAFGRDKFGHDPALLLNAFCMFMDGSFLAFAGAEKGDEEFFRTMLSLRRELSPLRYGSCDYMKCSTDSNHVVAFYREFQKDYCILLFNFSNDEVKCNLSISGALPECSGRIVNVVDKTVIGHGHMDGMNIVIPANGLMILRPE